jgi:hypothetical protein
MTGRTGGLVPRFIGASRSSRSGAGRLRIPRPRAEELADPTHAASAVAAGSGPTKDQEHGSTSGVRVLLRGTRDNAALACASAPYRAKRHSLVCDHAGSLCRGGPGSARPRASRRPQQPRGPRGQPTKSAVPKSSRILTLRYRSGRDALVDQVPMRRTTMSWTVLRYACRLSEWSLTSGGAAGVVAKRGGRG